MDDNELDYENIIKAFVFENILEKISFRTLLMLRNAAFMVFMNSKLEYYEEGDGDSYSLALEILNEYDRIISIKNHC